MLFQPFLNHLWCVRCKQLGKMRLQWAMRARQYATLTLQARISMSSRTRRAAAAIRCTDTHLLLTGNDLNGLFQILQIGAQPAAYVIIVDLLVLDGGGPVALLISCACWMMPTAAIRRFLVDAFTVHSFFRLLKSNLTSYLMAKKYCFWIVNTQKRYYFACFVCAECTFFHTTSKSLLRNTKLFSQHVLGVASLYHVGFE